MKRIGILAFFLLFSFQAYPFWIWSPKTQKWKNPKYSALATPYLQYKAATKLFDQDRYKEAYKEFKKLLVHYPDAKEAAEAQYYLARCLEKFGKPYDAFLAYQKIIDSYPNSQRINEVIEREYNIGEYFLNREHKKWLGLSLYDFVEHPSVEIFARIVDKAPYSEYAPRAQYKIGIIFAQLRRYDEARDAFQKVIDNYSDSEWAAPAKYQLAIATSKAFPGADYDSSYLSEATARLDEFIKSHPEAQISASAQEQLRELRNREAKKNFDIADFYEKQEQYKSALIYYQKVVRDYPESDYYNLSLERIEEIDKLVKGNLTRGDLIKQQKKRAAEERRNEKIRLKAEKRERKREAREEKIRVKKEKKEAAKIKKEARRKEKLKKKEEKRARKEALRQERIDRKKELREKERIEKLRKAEEKKARKEARRQEKIRKREEARRRKQELKEKRNQEKLNTEEKPEVEEEND